MRAYYVAETLSENIHKTPEGFLLCKNVPIARTGWQSYRASELGLGAEDGYNGGELVKVYRDEAEVFSPSTIASFEGKSVTSPHPPTFLNPSNYAGYQLGHMQNIRKGPVLPNGERALLADLFIKDDRLIQRVENGLREVSCGYDCKYAAIGDHQYSQTEIVGNHLAVVENGRAGNNVRILDSKGEEEQPMNDEKEVSIGMIRSIANFLEEKGWKRPTADSSDPLKTAEEKTEKGEERKVARNADEDKEKEAKDAEEKKANDARLTRIEDSVKLLVKHSQDAEEEKKKEKEAEDAKRVKDAKDAEEKEAMKDAKCDCGAEGDEKHEADCAMMDKKTKDAELIPVEILAPEDRPKNPIPGAAKAKDALMAIKPLIARRGTMDEKKAWNRAYTALTDATTDSKTEDAEYGEILKGKRPEGTGTNDEKNTRQQGADFQKTAAQFHRKNPGQVEIKREEKK